MAVYEWVRLREHLIKMLTSACEYDSWSCGTFWASIHWSSPWTILRSSHVIRFKGWLGMLLTVVILSEPWLHSEPGRGGSSDWKWGQIVGLCCSRQNGCTVTKASENTWITCIPVLQCTSSLFNIPSIITKSLLQIPCIGQWKKRGGCINIWQDKGPQFRVSREWSQSPDLVH